ncbi:MAG TPA: hypothetical protein VGQ17_06265 [Gemmatimonadales bacterium]|nr:hypothetical protein [Gemmatimonadales bacterium]
MNGSRAAAIGDSSIGRLWVEKLRWNRPLVKRAGRRSTPRARAGYTGGRFGFWAIPAGGGKPELLAMFDNPAFASARQEFATNGKRLYFTADDRQSDIKVMEVRRPQ